MGEQMPPDWAIEKATQPALPFLSNSVSRNSWTPNEIKRGANELAYCAVVLELARYIAEHEQAPVDPFEAAFDDLYNNGSLRSNADIIRAALKRGMELAGGKPS